MKYVSILLTALFLFACSADPTPAPQLDLSGVNPITPRVDAQAVAEAAQLADEETLALGEEVYNANCASCHGAEGEGQFPNNPMQPDETGRIGAPPHTSAGHTWHHPDQLLIQIIREGSNAPQDMFYPMPAFGDQLSDEEIVAVLEFIKTWWSEDERRVQAERTLMTEQQ